jgi:hypothetical protein
MYSKSSCVACLMWIASKMRRLGSQIYENLGETGVGFMSHFFVLLRSNKEGKC